MRVDSVRATENTKTHIILLKDNKTIRQGSSQNALLIFQKYNDVAFCIYFMYICLCVCVLNMNLKRKQT